MFANLLETHYEIDKHQNALTSDEYDEVPGKRELWDGMLGKGAKGSPSNSRFKWVGVVCPYL